VWCDVLLHDEALEIHIILSGNALQRHLQMRQLARAPVSNDEADLRPLTLLRRSISEANGMVTDGQTHELRTETGDHLRCVQIRSPLPIAPIAAAIWRWLKDFVPIAHGQISFVASP
jgi:hypothetical protein